MVSSPPGTDVAEAVALGPLTTLGVGPVADRVYTCHTTEALAATVTALDRAGAAPLLLAGGSNVVLNDELTDLTVVRVANDAIEVDGAALRAEAGAGWDDVVVAALGAGLGGLECLSGIPGSAGATPVQNVGAYGVEVADTLRRALLLDRATGQRRWAVAAELDFGYRTSLLRKAPGRYVVLEVEFALDPEGRSAPIRYGELARALGVPAGARTDPARVRETVLALRAAKGMVLDAADPDTASVGSFFVNPVVPAEVVDALERRFGSVPRFPAHGGVKLAAAWLVEQAGFGRGHPGAGPARLSTKHTLAVTNRGGATSADVLALAREIRDGVVRAFGIELHPEPTLVGCRL
ncbi:UDP-N-acetylmuramate dehydrogenase [Mycobacterium sp. MYCO198283]|uniref:UDP-N-acetylmuramate dehydrogenase n=1 Tax=Mycobacterium sp. MYCO198283 TaxID=2883505 RepID=UPI001E39FECB|nr:UDP-N-acetylmuramate dehydrogenase [Mycobacterium sp. MYCO198283]MCG5432297.1 UDP-N-acetylmuramate dehydrogenase [Mycobacterium sp. MYCO198283]